MEIELLMNLKQRDVAKQTTPFSFYFFVAIFLLVENFGTALELKNWKLTKKNTKKVGCSEVRPVFGFETYQKNCVHQKALSFPL